MLESHMLRPLELIQRLFLASPLTCLSFGIAAWLSARIFLQWQHRYVTDSFALDLHLFDGSPVAGPYNMTYTAFYFGGLGVLLGIVAVFRRREAWRWWALLAVALNVSAYVTTVFMNLWALSPPLGIEY
jgi:hypothetical protein